MYNCNVCRIVTLTVLVRTIGALGHFLRRIISGGCRVGEVREMEWVDL